MPVACHPPLRSDKLLAVVQPHTNVLVLTHDNPDPDAIAAGWAIHTLVREKLGLPVRLVGGGEIVRAENRYMVTLLQPPLELIQDIEPDERTALVLVDCGIEARNWSGRDNGARPVAVIDHHAHGRSRMRLGFRDVRPRVAASATIAADYLRQQGIEPTVNLATAIVYGIRSETSGNETAHSRLDRSVLRWLSQVANPAFLAQIQSAPLSLEYFGDLALALQNAFVYGDVVFCCLPRASSAEIVGEVADLLSRCEGMQRILCAGAVRDDLLVSVRTRHQADHASDLVRKTLHGLGHGGGHEHRAGGKIPGVVSGSKISEAQQGDLRKRWLSACGVQEDRGVRLIARRQIVRNL